MANRLANLGLPVLPNPPALLNPSYHRIAKRLHVHQMLGAQDRPLTPGRRVILEEGWRSNPASQSYDIDSLDEDVDTASPLNTDTRTVHEMEGVHVTPGHVLRFEARCLPSAMTQIYADGDTGYINTGAQGTVRLTAVWNDTAAGSATVITDLDFVSPPTTYGHGPDLPGAGYWGLTEEWTLNFPTAMIFDQDEIVRFSQAGVTVDLTLEYIGGVRAVDVVVYEVPMRFGLDDADDAGPAHIYQNNEAEIGQGILSEYPIEGASSGDKRFGAQRALDVVSATQLQTGPTILSFSTHTEAIRTESGDPAPIDVTSTSLATLPGMNSTQTWDISGGTFGRRFASASPDFSMGDSGCVRVLVSVYWKPQSLTSCTLRVESAVYSYVELTRDTATYGWTHAVAHLEVGQTVLDGQQLTITAKVSGGTTEIRYIHVSYMPE